MSGILFRGSREVVRYGLNCGRAHQVDIPFTYGNVNCTFRFQRHVVDLLRLGRAISNIARHLGVGWDMVKDIHKKYQKGKYSHLDISKVTKIGIDEFAVKKGHLYKTTRLRLR